MNKVSGIFTGLLVATSLLLGACTDVNQFAPTANTPEAADPAEAKLAEAAQSVNNSLLNLNAIQQAVTPPPKTFQPPDPASYGMENLVSIDWTGPIEPLLQQIAKSTHYRVKVIGKRPAIPVMVQVYEKNQPIGDILRNVGYQSVQRADIVVFPRSHTIELRYKNT